MEEKITKPVIVKGGNIDGEISASIGDYQLIIDRSDGNGPRSIELMLVGLGTCTFDTVKYYMKRKGLPIEQLSVEIRADASDKGKFFDRIYLNLRLDDRISEKEKGIILNVAKTCRIHNTLNNKPDIEIEIYS